MRITPDDLLESARVCTRTLTSVANSDWSVPAGELEWSCRTTLAHVADGLTLYAVQLATAATARRPGPCCRDEELSQPEFLENVECRAAVLAAVARATPPDSRAFHPAGMAHADGFCAMGCDEILVHTWDVASGLGVVVHTARDLVARVVARLFPWAPATGDPWDSLLWANGRIALAGRARLDENWYWQCAPLDEWDSTPKRRTASTAST